MEDLNQPATKADVRASEERMQEFMRGLQTELLREFAIATASLSKPS